jgi:two-component system probable response regulator PhcQ
MQMAAGEDGVKCRMVAAENALTPSQLAAWVEQF